MDNEIILYIVKKNDTLASISEKTKCSISEIQRLNPLTKQRVFEGQPLILNITQNSDLRKEEKQTLQVLNNKTHILKITKVIEAFKTLILSKIYFPKGLITFKNVFEKSIVELLDNVKEEDKNLILSYLKEISEETILLIDLIIQKNEKELLAYEKRLRSLYDKFKDVLSNYINKDVVIEITNKLRELWQLYILKILGKDFEEAQKDMEEITNLLTKKWAA